MREYLLGLATLPLIAAACYSIRRLWVLLDESGMVNAVVAVLTGRLAQTPHARALIGARLARCRRVWGVDLPGKVSLMITAGYDRPENPTRMYEQAARAIVKAFEGDDNRGA